MREHHMEYLETVRKYKMGAGERYEKADAACDNLSDAVDGLDEVINSLETAIE